MAQFKSGRCVETGDSDQLRPPCESEIKLPHSLFNRAYGLVPTSTAHLLTGGLRPGVGQIIEVDVLAVAVGMGGDDPKSVEVRPERMVSRRHG